jgi:hypothetical protein
MEDKTGRWSELNKDLLREKRGENFARQFNQEFERMAMEQQFQAAKQPLPQVGPFGGLAGAIGGLGGATSQCRPATIEPNLFLDDLNYLCHYITKKTRGVYQNVRAHFKHK